jgi:hypothetical protein
MNNEEQKTTEVKQTAVEWFFEQIEKGEIEIVYSDKIHSIKCIPEIIQQAKEMEKEQIAKAFDDGECNYFYSRKTGNDFEDGEEYYEELYGGNK